MNMDDESIFPTLNIAALKVAAHKWVWKIPEILKVTLFHGRPGEAAYQLVFRVRRKYSGLTDSMIPFDRDLINAYKPGETYSENDWGVFMETGSKLPTDFIVEEFPCVLYERAKKARQPSVMTTQPLQPSPESNGQADSGQAPRVDERPLIATSEERLNGKKAIAKFLRVSVDTVDVYTKEGMPVNHHKGRIWAFRSELNTWLQVRSTKKN
jgi:hypothetical protein